MKTMIELFGWYGTIAIVSAYALVSFSMLSPTSVSYQLLNITGSLGIVTASLHKKDYQSTVLNIIWILIAVVAIIRVFV
ncbi:hypothetical protein KBC54_01245 [Patescibacteria group bacterium]|nr:hypothetical protein [Patescibacteria group bacterium]